MTWLRLSLVWLLALVGAAEAHEITFTVVNLRLERDETRISVELPIKALLHEQPSPLPAGTTEQTFHAGQLPADLRTSLISLLSARLRVASGGKILPVTVGGIEPTGEYVVLTAAAPAITGVLDIRANLFPDDALHKAFFDVYRSGTLAGQYVLDRQDPAFTLAAPERALREVIGTFVREGIRHIFIGPDHILFVLALILLGGRLWSQIKVVTAFTVAHSTSWTAPKTSLFDGVGA